MKLNNFETSSKTYCSALKTLYNGNKMPIMQPLLKDGILEYDLKLRLKISITFLRHSVKKLLKLLALILKSYSSLPIVNNSKLSEEFLLTLKADLTQLTLTIV